MSTLGKTIIIIVACSLLLNACTLHFKGKDIQFDTETKDLGIVNTQPTNHTFELAKIDILKDARPQKTRTP